MRILVFSDSHGRGTERMLAVLERSDAKAVLFLGDGLDDFDAVSERYTGQAMLIAVRGNCDGYGDGLPTERIFSFGGKRILMLHGHTRAVKGGTGALEAYAREQRIDLVLYGHTHCPEERYLPSDEHAFYLVNPGSIGDGRMPTFATVSFHDDAILPNIVCYEEKKR